MKKQITKELEQNGWNVKDTGLTAFYREITGDYSLHLKLGKWCVTNNKYSCYCGNNRCLGFLSDVGEQDSPEEALALYWIHQEKEKKEKMMDRIRHETKVLV